MVSKTASIRQQVLETLKRAREPVSGQGLAERLAVSRTAVWKHITQLRQVGYEITGSPKVGYRLKALGDAVIAEELEAVLPAEFRGRIVCVDRVGSTNDVAKDMAGAGKFKPVGLIVAKRQTRGRGRFGRIWVSPPGGIWLSLIARPKIPVAVAGRVAILTAVAVAESIREVAGVAAKIKWPNDVLVNGKKVCGVLTEMAAELGSIEYLVIGIGVNANFPASRLAKGAETATTLQAEVGRPIARVTLIKAIITSITASLPRLTDGFDGILRRWKDSSDTLGRQVSLDAGGKTVEGLAVDIDGDGALIVELSSGGRQVFRAGEVTLGRS